MDRANDIKDKLAYTLLKYNNLQLEISHAQKNSETVLFIGQKTGDILSGCRECFDYCAKDLADAFFVNHSNNQKLVGSYKQGKTKVYFPFYTSQLSNQSNVFFELSNTNPTLHHHLVNLADKLKSKSTIPRTVICYSVALDLNEIVNSKKHDKITTATQKENSATLITFPDGAEVTMSPVFNYSGDSPDFGVDIGAMPMIGDKEVNIKYVKEYKLTHNNWEVTRFCLYSIQVTFHILSELYLKFFGVPIVQFNPWETIKPEKQKKAEETLRGILPITNRPMRIILFMDDNEVVNCEISFEGKPGSVNHTEISIANLFLLIFDNHFVVKVQSEINNYILANWEKIDISKLTPRYLEIDQNLNLTKKIVLNDKTEIIFNRILWGIGSRFRHDEKTLSLPSIGQSTMRSSLAIVNSAKTSFSLLTDKSGCILETQIVR